MKECLLWEKLKCNRGMMFPIALMLLFLATFVVISYVSTFEMQIKVYNALELSNVRATINILKQIEME